jgi:hypothetical protein
MSATLEVIEERITNMATAMGDWHKDIKENLAKEFGLMKERQDHTNGRVKSLEVWKAWTYGFSACVVAILLPIAFMVLKEHF